MVMVNLSHSFYSKLVEYLKMMADDNSGKGSPGLFTGGSVPLNCIRFLKQVLITWISPTTWKKHLGFRGFGRNGRYEQKQSWGSRPTQSLPEFRPLLPSGIFLPPNESSSLLPLEHTFHSLLQTSEPDYLYDTEAKRGRLEKSFTAIGSSVCLGAGAGGAYGLFDGIRWVFQLKLMAQCSI